MMGDVKAFKFTPLEEFDWFRGDTGVLVARYYPGNTYNCTVQPVHDKLREMCSVWESEGKIKVFPLHSTETLKIVEVQDNDDSA